MTAEDKKEKIIQIVSDEIDKSCWPYVWRKPTFWMRVRMYFERKRIRKRLQKNIRRLLENEERKEKNRLTKNGCVT